MVDVSSGKPRLRSPSVVHCVTNPATASSTGASLKVAPLVPERVKKMSATHVRTVCVNEVSVDGTTHNPEVQCAANSWSYAAMQSVPLKPSKGWERSVPQAGGSKVTLPSASWAETVGANSPAASKITLCSFIVVVVLSLCGQYQKSSDGNL